MSNSRDIYVRPLEEGDVSKIMVLLDQVNLVHFNARPDIFKHDTKFSEEDVKRSFIGNEKAPVFVCVEVNEDGSEEVLGHAFCEIQESQGNSVVKPMRNLYIDDICVDEKARRRGIGRRLYHHVVAYAEEEGGFDKITLNVWSFNEAAYKFYLSLGFAPQRTIMEKILRNL